jgi:hypothetical protein
MNYISIKLLLKKSLMANNQLGEIFVAYLIGKIQITLIYIQNSKIISKTLTPHWTIRQSQ